MTATQFIHIGRNRCASTTLQYFFLNNIEALAAAGVDYFVFGQMTKSFPNSPGFPTHIQYGAHIKANPNRSTLISNEDFMGYGDLFAPAQVKSLEDAPRRIIAYIRDYCSWVRSAYMETVMTGLACLDFDAYVRQSHVFVSAMPSLQAWGDLAGWDNMHVRALDPANLHQGDVVLDCARVMGLPESIVHGAKLEPKHVSPHWICVEIIRYIRAAHAQADWRTFTHEIVYKLQPLIMRAIVEAGAADVQAEYLTAEHAQRFGDLYNADVAVLNSRMDSNIPRAPAQRADGRSFLPSLEHVPIEVLQALLQLAAEEYGRDVPPAHAALRSAFRWLHDAR